MDLTTYLAEDYQWIDDPRTVTFHEKTANRPNAYADEVQVENCLRTAPTRDDVELLATAEVVFNLWKSQMGETPPVPKNGDVVEEADQTRWTVKRVQIMDEGERYRLTCQKER